MRLAIAVGLSLSALAAPAIAGPSDSASTAGPRCSRGRCTPLLPRRLGVDENEYSLLATHNPVAAGRVEFNVTNFGMDAHDLSIRTIEGRLLSSTPLASGDTRVYTVVLSPGTYTLYCSLPDHEALGMRATLVTR